MHLGSTILIGAIIAAMLTASAQAQPTDCTATAASIRKAESELPRLEAAPPGDKQIVCITLETVIVFARRFDAHVAQCPRSPHAAKAATWRRTASDYTARFRDRRCEPAIRGYRG